jgi:tRNA threonylcarbamoyladenosine biosynthesis protein TsaE
MTASVVLRTRSADETRRVGRALGEAARPGDVLLLEGAFGVGKTVLVQGLAAGLGVREDITSPSFVLMVEHRGRLPLYHVDLYRLDGRLDDEMLDNLADYQEAGGVCAIEWPGALPPELRVGATVITISAPDEPSADDAEGPAAADAAGAAGREIAIESPDARLVHAARAALEVA